MNLKQIEAFVQVAERQSFSETARFLYLTQPTVSAHIAALEKEMNECLFLRNKKRITLTPKGEELYTYAKQVTLLMEQIESSFLANEKDVNAACLTIAASSVPAQHLLPEILFHFQKRYPKIQFFLKETDSVDVADIIKNGQADIGFSGSKNYRKACKYIPFYKDELVIITPNEKRFQIEQTHENITKLLLAEPIILREKGSGTRNESLKVLEKLGIPKGELNIAASIENTETIKQSVCRGMGISIISSLAVKKELEERKLLSYPLGDDAGKRNIYIVYNREFPMSSATKKFTSIMKKLYPECKL